MPETLGIDPTSADTLGWAAIESGGLTAFGELSMKDAPGLPYQPGASDEIRRLAFQAWCLVNLLSDRHPASVAIERAILNSRAAARYLSLAADSGEGQSMVGRLTGSLSRSIDVGMAVGVLLRVCMDACVPVYLVNPGQAKVLACGSVAAKKELVRDAARLRIYELKYQEAVRAGAAAPEVRKIKRPSEHIAAAIFVGLAGDHLSRIAFATQQDAA